MARARDKAAAYGCWGKGPDCPPPQKLEIMIEPANTILVKQINWEAAPKPSPRSCFANFRIIIIVACLCVHA